MADVEHALPWIKPGWRGVEVGVHRGDSAERLLRHGVGFLYLVDPWDAAKTWPDYQGRALGSEDYDECMRILEPFRAQYAVFRMTSAEAADYLPELDFAWIDANHRYGPVKQDLELYWPKVKPGGILCGDDYGNDGEGCQVKRAVDEFALKHNLAFRLAGRIFVMEKR